MSNRVKQLIFSFFPHQPTPEQDAACDALIAFLFDPDPRSLFVLSGYAGTGKTSLMAALIQAAPSLRISTLLLAPTGRAAKVLSNYSHRQAFTIHKIIYRTATDSQGNSRCVRVPNKHAYTLFIVDEASMIGTNNDFSSGRPQSLLEDLIDYVYEGSHCRLLFVGDSAQLPPVGSPESPALSSDRLSALASVFVHSASLSQVVRQHHMSGILSNATAVRQQIVHLDSSSLAQYPLFDISRTSDVVRLNGADLPEMLNIEYADKSIDDVVIITRTNKRANLFNSAIRNRILFREDEINTGDYLMVVKNNYFWADESSPMSFIANGDIVEVMSARNFSELYGFHFADVTLRFVDYDDAPLLDCKILLETLYSESPSLTRDESQKLYTAVAEDYADIPNRTARMEAIRSNPFFNALQVKFAYALTCHKTQGGQWASVFLDQGFLTDDMFNREYLRWLYTALTRATQKVYLLNFEDKFFLDADD